MVLRQQLRAFTIAVTVLALVSNGLSTSLFQQFINKLYRSGSGSLVYYSYLATFISAVGVFGSIRQHAPAMSMFAHFFAIDTMVSAISRSIILYVFSTFRSYLCDANITVGDGGLLSTTLPHGAFHQPLSDQPNEVSSSLWDINWGCIDIMRVSVMVGWVSLIATTTFQMFFAILVLQYADSLFLGRHDDLERGTTCPGESVRETDGPFVDEGGVPHRVRAALALGPPWPPSREPEKVC